MDLYVASVTDRNLLPIDVGQDAIEPLNHYLSTLAEVTNVMHLGIFLRTTDAAVHT
ncbi:hypothetical protein D3C84_1152680 [compost metagenome]